MIKGMIIHYIVVVFHTRTIRPALTDNSCLPNNSLLRDLYLIDSVVYY